MADDRQCVAAGDVLARGKGPAEHRLAADKREKVPGRLGQPQSARLMAALDIHFVGEIHGSVRQVWALPTPLVEFSTRRRERVQHCQPVQVP